MWKIRSGEYIRIGVRDNGKGFDALQIDTLLRDERTVESVGIYNVNQRVKRMCHMQLCIENRPEAARMSIFWPFCRVDDLGILSVLPD